MDKELKQFKLYYQVRTPKGIETTLYLFEGESEIDFIKSLKQNKELLDCVIVNIQNYNEYYRADYLDYEEEIYSERLDGKELFETIITMCDKDDPLLGCYAIFYYPQYNENTGEEIEPEADKIILTRRVWNRFIIDLTTTTPFVLTENSLFDKNILKMIKEYL